MKSQLAIELKKLLDGLSQEEFNTDWNEIQSLNLSGPTISAALNYFSINQQRSSSFEIVDTDADTSISFYNKNYTTAA